MVPRKVLTLAFVVRQAQDHAVTHVLLGEKKRGFGKGKWNGFGGKVEAQDLSIASGAVREIQEEAHVTVQVADLEPRGQLTFTFADREGMLEVHVFLTTQFAGEPRESDEMRPVWYPVEQIPYEKMWTDDQYWLPHVLAGKCIRGHFHFAGDESSILTQELTIFDTWSGFERDSLT